MVSVQNWSKAVQKHKISNLFSDLFKKMISQKNVPCVNKDPLSKKGAGQQCGLARSKAPGGYGDKFPMVWTGSLKSGGGVSRLAFFISQKQRPQAHHSNKIIGAYTLFGSFYFDCDPTEIKQIDFKPELAVLAQKRMFWPHLWLPGARKSNLLHRS